MQKKFGKVCLVGMYPVYDREIAFYNKVGLPKFWHTDGFDVHNPERKTVKPLQQKSPNTALGKNPLPLIALGHARQSGTTT
jgi:hypothetical protein